MFDFDGLEAEAPPPARKAPSIQPTAGVGSGILQPGSRADAAASAAPHRGGGGVAAADAMIARLKEAAWAAEEAARPPSPPDPPEEEAVDAAAPAASVEEASPQLSPEESQAEHAALIERLKRAAMEFNESAPSRDLAREEPVIVGSALFGRSAFDAPYVPSAEERVPVQAVGEDESSDREGAIRDYSGPVANAIAYTREMQAARRARDRAAAAAKAEEEVKEVEPEIPYELTRSWAPETALFRISGRVLPMHLERTGVTPHEVTRIWEREWGIAYASRLRFEAPPDTGTKWLNLREDELPAPPTVTRLDGKPPILDALALALTQRDEELLVQSIEEGEERWNQAGSRGAGHGGKWIKKAETFRWSTPAAYDPEDDHPGRVPIWPPMEPPEMPDWPPR
mmetsp:Transcript_92694/g.286157  ORF Transcript_92694/g.286157 Transcript_92694/m.286157 type:complete len:398 (-) Transcript_92694:98-1291(-)